eukprot:PhF_6_TR4601/c0_g1_i1/m.6456
MVSIVVCVFASVMSGFLIMAILQRIQTTYVYPIPKSINQRDKTQMSNYMNTLPMTAFLMLLATHTVGAGIAGFTMTALTGSTQPAHLLRVGAIFLLCGVFNVKVIQHPRWFVVVDLVMYIPSAMVGGHV